eukprot:scaffold15964_cov135-Isochrysis_galbana.AAC.7
MPGERPSSSTCVAWREGALAHGDDLEREMCGGCESTRLGGVVGVGSAGALKLEATGRGELGESTAASGERGTGVGIVASAEVGCSNVRTRREKKTPRNTKIKSAAPPRRKRGAESCRAACDGVRLASGRGGALQRPPGATDEHAAWQPLPARGNLARRASASWCSYSPRRSRPTTRRTARSSSSSRPSTRFPTSTTTSPTSSLRCTTSRAR